MMLILIYFAARLDYVILRLAYGWVPAWRPIIELMALDLAGLNYL